MTSEDIDSVHLNEPRPTPPTPQDAEQIAYAAGYTLFYLRREHPLLFQWRAADGTYRAGFSEREAAMQFAAML